MAEFLITQTSPLEAADDVTIRPTIQVTFNHHLDNGAGSTIATQSCTSLIDENDNILVESQFNF